MPKSPVPPTGLAPVLAGRLLDLIIRGEHEVGDRLTEQSLADELGVSRSPVRKALQFLEQLGALGSTPNCGFHVARPAAQLRKIKLPTDTESDEAVYMRIVEDRLKGVVEEEVSEAELMERYDLTRLQVQRVLNRMARESLIDRKPGRGWIFRPLLDSVSSHRESYRFRMVIEPAAILEPSFRIDRALFDKVRRQQMQLLDSGIERWTAAERFRAGSEFHEAIVACSGNRFFLDALRNVNQLRRVIEYHSQTGSLHDRERLRRQCEEHLMLLDLLEAGERMEASHALRQHLDVVRAIKTGEMQSARNDGTRGSGSRSAYEVEVHL
ncbi:GntR family transcriptional regulator [Piscinibacter sakaiensis]|uniref:GntR family transcriptional regulator n=1 Tax=Piscinibacter sakaiensis TaxID=1547922 RepID=UPI003AAB57CB